ncbi:MAG: ATP-binding protein [Bacteroidota bacterium]|nr:ATP-binding protein [Bacteroidota bacterium]
MENQNIEYKETWRDEYIKWICGFSNANGGKLYIGISDKGIVTGLKEPKKLLEEIPNKTKDILGILVNVNLKTKTKKQYLEIIIEPYPSPVSYKGQYHYRSGSTKQELKGAALDKFILQKQGKHWDSVPQPNITIKELAKSAFDYFKIKAADTKRMPIEFLKDKPNILLERLHLKADKIYYKRAVALLFHPDPEKYVTGAYVKVGFFNSDDDLAFQDEIHGHLFEQVEKTVDLLLTKYLKASISYKGLNRMEQYPVPEAAIREALLNAIVHKDYSSGNPIQISVYNNKLIIWNEGQLPDDWTVERLKTKHPSRPFNPDIANCFFRAGLIETWGRGTIKIINECKQAKVPQPIFKYDLSGFIIEFNYTAKRPFLSTIPKAIGTSTDKVMYFIANNETITISELSEKINVGERTIKRILKQLQDENKIKRLGGNKGGHWEIRSL